MREVTSRSRRAILFVAWVSLALAVAGCGGGGGGDIPKPTPTTGASTAQGQSASVPPSPSITGVTPTSASAAKLIEIDGANFGSAQFQSSEVVFIRSNGQELPSGNVQAPSDWSDKRIRVLLLSNFTTDEDIQIQVRLRGGASLGGVESKRVKFHVNAAFAPTVSSVAPRNVVAGQTVTISGANFGDAQFGDSAVFFSGANGALIKAGTATIWTDNQIVIAVPPGAQSGPVVVLKGSLQSTPNQSSATQLILADTTPPVLVSSGPTNNASGVDPRTTIDLVFSKAMGGATTDPTAYLLVGANGAQRTIRAVVALSPNTFELFPAQPLDGGVKWSLFEQVTPTKHITDLSGNAFSGFNLSFGVANVPGISGSDRTPPVLVSTLPPNDAIQVSVDASIQLNFSKPVTIGANAITLTTVGNTFIPLSISPAIGTTANFFVIKPQQRLRGGAIFTLNISANVFDQAGNNFPGAVLTFTTQEVPGVPGSDFTPPALVNTNPANGARNVSPNTQILLIFSKNISQATAGSVGNYSIATSGVAFNPTTAAVNGSTVILSFGRPLLVGTLHTLFISSNIKDLAGNSLAPTNPVTFTTLYIPGQAGDSIAPTVVNINPPDGSQNVSPNADIFITFSKAMGLPSITSAANYILTSSGGQVTLTPIQLGATSVRLKVTPGPLVGGIDYQLLLTSGLHDTVPGSPNNLVPVFVRFHTATIPGELGADITPPLLLSSNPGTGSTTVDHNVQILLVFSKQLKNASSVTHYNITSSGAPAFHPTTATVSGAAVVLSFAGGLLVNTDYQLSLTGITDLAGNALQPTSPILFHTALILNQPGDKTSPTVTSTSPKPGDVVDINTDIFITFNKGMAPSQLTTAAISAGSIRLTTNGGSYPVTPQLIGSQTAPTSLRLVPSKKPLPGNTPFSLFLTSQLTDLQGNPLVPVSINFKTTNVVGVAGADTSPFILSRTVPPNGANGVPPLTNIVLTFNKPPGALAASSSAYTLTTFTAPTVPFCSVTATVIQSTVSLLPQKTLLGGTLYELTLSPNLKDSAGNTLVPTSPVLFRTSSVPGLPGDTQPPTVLSVSPQANTTVATNEQIVVTFSKSMLLSSITSSANYVLTTAGGGFPIGKIIAASQTIAILTPGKDPSGKPALAPGLKYTLFISNSIQDTVGNRVIPFSTSFSTVPLITDTVAPIVVSVNPAPNTTVATATQIIVTFSKSMLISSITSSANYVLTTAGGPFPILPGRVVSPNAVTAVITPGNDPKGRPALAAGLRYFLSISNNIRDTVGNRLIPFNAQFTTLAAITDTVAPTVLSVNPAPNTTVATNSQIIINFSKPMDPVSVKSNTSYVLTTSGGSFPLLAANISQPNPTSVILSPGNVAGKSSLTAGLRYFLLITNAIKDTSGNRLIPFSTQFSTLSVFTDTIAPTVTSVNPAPNTTIATSSQIIVTFSKPMDPLTIKSATSYVLTTPGGSFPILAANISQPNPTSVILSPGTIVGRSSLAAGFRYLLILTNALKDTSGNRLVVFNTTFSTLSSGDNTPPTLVASNPPDGAQNVSSGSLVFVTFSKRMGSSVLSAANFTITSPTGSYQAKSVVQASSPQNTFTVDPGRLAGKTQYVVVLSNKIQDFSGNALVPTAFKFTTADFVGGGSDTTPPTVLATNPPNGSRAASINTSITVTFDKQMNTVSFRSGGLTSATGEFSALNPTNYEFFSSQGQIGIANIIQLSFPANTFVLTPARTPLLGGTLHELVVTSRIHDSVGNSMVSSLFQFTTVSTPGQPGSDTTSPTVTAINPPNNSNILNQNTAIIVSFSEAMRAGPAANTDSVTNTANYFLETACDTKGTGASVVSLNRIIPLTSPVNSYRFAFVAGPPGPLPTNNLSYILEMGNGLVSVSGNPLSPFRSVFTLGSPPQKPTVSFTTVDASPVSVQTGGFSTAPIRITFNETVAAPADFSANFSVAGTAVDSTITTHTASIVIDTTDSNLSGGTQFNIVLARSGVSFPDRHFQLKSSSSFTLLVTGIKSSGGSCQIQMDSFSKTFSTP